MANDELTMAWVDFVKQLGIKFVLSDLSIALTRVVFNSYRAPEDAAFFGMFALGKKKATTSNGDPQRMPSLEAGLVASHRNEAENFALVAAVAYAYTLCTPDVGAARSLFSFYVVARYVYMASYAARAQPFRTLAFFASLWPVVRMLLHVRATLAARGG